MASRLIFILLLAGVGLNATPPCDQSPNPCYTNVADILGGNRQLLRMDDLVIASSVAADSGNYTSTVYNTASLKIGATNNFPAIGQSRCNYLPAQPQSARMFAIPNDVVVTLAPTAAADDRCSGNLNFAYYVTDPVTPANNSVTPLTLLNNNFWHAVADFNQDGLDDIVVQNDNGISIHTAKDGTDPKAGLVLGGGWSTSGNTAASPPAVGDFNGDGALDIAWVGIDVSQFTWVAYMASVCPSAGVTILGVTCTQPFQTFQTGVYISIGAFITGADPRLPNQPVLVAGNFKGVPGQSQLVINRKVSGSATYHDLLSYSFDSVMTPTFHNAQHFPVNADMDAGYLAAGRLNWFDQSDSVAFTSRALGTISVVTFDTNLTMTVRTIPIPSSGDGRSATTYGVAIGRFDPPKNGDGSTNFNNQIAVLGTSAGAGNADPQTRITIFTVDPNAGLAPQLSSDNVVANSLLFGSSVDNFPCNFLARGDTQGRSLTLGQPNKVTISGHMQTDLVLGIPPMHIDYIRDAQNLNPVSGKPSLLNLTVMPSLPAPGVGFSTAYSFISTASNDVSTTGSSSWGYSIGGSSDQKVTVGNPKASFFSVEAKEAGKDTYSTNSGSSSSNFQSVTNSLSATTGFADHLFFTQSRLNIYYYQVMGQSQCPDGSSNCPDNEKGPVFIQLSGPDMVERSDLDATTQEWYQPPHEPGNIFSYPWSLSQMQVENPQVVALTQDPAPWRATDTSTSSYNTTWKGAGSSGVTTGSSSSHSFDFSVTATGQLKGTILGYGVTGRVSGTFNYGKSDSTTSQTVTTSKLDASTGIQVNKPAFRDEVATTYLYSFGGYVLGKAKPDTFDEKTVTDANGQPLGQQANGPLVVSFLADPTRDGAPWWRQAYSRPDVGLSHPARWSYAKATQVASFNARNPQTLPQDDPFYHMKGLYITAADALDNSPQLTTAPAGTLLRLKVRVYNFSLTDMPSDARVHVRFYGQEYENATLVGNAFPLGEDVIGPIPAFQSVSAGGNAPNWSFGNATFDTTNHANKHFVFWVVVWADNAGGLIPELEGHGLTRTPTGATYTQITDVPVEDYSNNVGMYGSYTPFFVAPVDALTVDSSHVPLRVNPKDLELTVVGRAEAAKRVNLRIKLRNIGTEAIESVPVAIYDGDPADRGQVIDIQRITHLRGKSTHTLRTHFTPERFGLYQLFVRVGRQSHLPVTRSFLIRVE